MVANLKEGGIWVAVHTPFRDDGSLDEEGIAGNIRRFIELGLQGAFFNGLFGEHWALTLDERKRIAEISVKAAAGRFALTPNCTHHSLAETIDLAKHAQSCGCDYVVLMNPASTPRGDAELLAWFSRVADAVDIDLIIFNTPAPGYMLKADVISRLADTGRYKVLKAAGGSHEVAEARRLAGDRIIVSDPNEGTWLGNLLAHDQRLLYADPEPYLYQSTENRPIQSMLDAYRAGRLDELVATHRSLVPMRTVYEEWVFGPVRKGRASCAALKYWAAKRGFAAGPVRAPLAPLSAAECHALDGALSRIGV